MSTRGGKTQVPVWFMDKQTYHARVKREKTTSL